MNRRGRTDRLAWEAAHPEEIAGENGDPLLDSDGKYDGTYLQEQAPI